MTKSIALGATVNVGDVNTLVTHVNTRINEKARLKTEEETARLRK